MIWIKTRENGDATSSYNIDPQCETVEELVKEILHYSQMAREWGSIMIAANDTRSYIDIIKFSTKEVTYTYHYNHYRKQKIKSVRANGGWGAMNYYIDCQEEDE